MKTELTKLDATKRQINIEVSGDIVKNKFEEVFKKIGEKAKVAGFRPGHVPRDILEKHFSGEVHQEVLNQLVPDIYHQAAQKEGLQTLDLPEIADVKLDRNSLSFTARVEVMPEVPLKHYKGIRVSYKKAEVSPDELKRNIDSLKESRKADGADDALARSLGYPAFSGLEKAIERQLLMQKENVSHQQMETQIIEQLTKDADFKLPAALVERQLQDLIKRAKIELAMKGVPKDKIEEQEKTLTAELEAEARQQVKVYLILSAIAKKENIAQDDHMTSRVMEFLFREADWQIA